MASDSVKADSIAAKAELMILKQTKLGDIRTTPLIPAFDADMEWVCVKSEDTMWTFEGKFCGVPSLVAQFEIEGERLVLTVVPV